MSAVLAARGVQHAYGAQPVLRGVDIDLRPGEATVLLGANGAGKTTLIRVLAGELIAKRGVVTIAGHAVNTERGLRALAYIAQDPPLADFLTTLEHAEAMAQLRERSWDDVKLELESAARRLELLAHLARPVRSLSGGMRQKAALCLALSAGAQVLLLDEPYAGLDIRSAHALRQLMIEQRDKGGALLIASHLAESALAVADRALLLHDGRLALDLDKTDLASFDGDPRAFEAAILAAMPAM